MKITIETTVNASIEEVWSAWTTPERITQWNFASDDWQCPSATLDLKEGGAFSYRMEAKDGSMGFDFEGVFSVVDRPNEIQYTLGDDRPVIIRFVESDGGVKVSETFEAEDVHTGEQQRQGWQCILENFKAHVEAR